MSSISSSIVSGALLLKTSNDSSSNSLTAIDSNSSNTDVPSSPQNQNNEDDLSDVEELYTICEKVGEGSFGKVYKCISKQTNEVVALKQVRVDTREEAEKLVKECQLVCEIIAGEKNKEGHGNFLLYNTFFMCNHISNKYHHFYIEMPFCEEGDLSLIIEKRKELKRPFSQSEVISYFLQLSNAVNILSRNDLMHRDLKTCNILLRENGSKLLICDYGFLKAFDKDIANTMGVGTISTAAPEQLSGDGTYDKSVDIFSLGCIFFEIVTFRRLIMYHEISQDERACHKKIMNVIERVDEYDLQFKRDVVKLILQMLRNDPSKRIKPEQIIKSLKAFGKKKHAQSFISRVPSFKIQEKKSQPFNERIDFQMMKNILTNREERLSPTIQENIREIIDLTQQTNMLALLRHLTDTLSQFAPQLANIAFDHHETLSDTIIILELISRILSKHNKVKNQQLVATDDIHGIFVLISNDVVTSGFSITKKKEDEEKERKENEEKEPINQTKQKSNGIKNDAPAIISEDTFNTFNQNPIDKELATRLLDCLQSILIDMKNSKVKKDRKTQNYHDMIFELASDVTLKLTISDNDFLITTAEKTIKQFKSSDLQCKREIEFLQYYNFDSFHLLKLLNILHSSDLEDTECDPLVSQLSTIVFNWISHHPLEFIEYRLEKNSLSLVNNHIGQLSPLLFTNLFNSNSKVFETMNSLPLSLLLLHSKDVFTTFLNNSVALGYDVKNALQRVLQATQTKSPEAIEASLAILQPCILLSEPYLINRTPFGKALREIANNVIKSVHDVIFYPDIHGVVMTERDWIDIITKFYMFSFYINRTYYLFTLIPLCNIISPIHKHAMLLSLLKNAKSFELNHLSIEEWIFLSIELRKCIRKLFLHHKTSRNSKGSGIILGTMRSFLKVAAGATKKNTSFTYPEIQDLDSLMVLLQFMTLQPFLFTYLSENELKENNLIITESKPKSLRKSGKKNSKFEKKEVSNSPQQNYVNFILSLFENIFDLFSEVEEDLKAMQISYNALSTLSSYRLLYAYTSFDLSMQDIFHLTCGMMENIIKTVHGDVAISEQSGKTRTCLLLLRDLLFNTYRIINPLNSKISQENVDYLNRRRALKWTLSTLIMCTCLPNVEDLSLVLDCFDNLQKLFFIDKESPEVLNEIVKPVEEICKVRSIELELYELLYRGVVTKYRELPKIPCVIEAFIAVAKRLKTSFQKLYLSTSIGSVVRTPAMERELENYFRFLIITVSLFEEDDKILLDFAKSCKTYQIYPNFSKIVKEEAQPEVKELLESF